MKILRKKPARVAIRLEIDPDVKGRFQAIVEQAAKAGYDLDVPRVVSAALDRAAKAIAAELGKAVVEPGDRTPDSSAPTKDAAQERLAAGVRITRS